MGSNLTLESPITHRSICKKSVKGYRLLIIVLMTNVIIIVNIVITYVNYHYPTR